MVLLWLLGGAISTTIVYLLVWSVNDHWLAANTAAILAVLYCFILIAFMLKKPFSRKTSIITLIIVIIFFGFTYRAWSIFYEMTTWQKNKLLEVRSIIYEGSHYNNINSVLHKTLKQFHRNNPGYEKTLKQIFEEQYAGRMAELNLFGMSNLYLEDISNFPDSTFSFISDLQDDRIELIGQCLYVEGLNPDFENYFIKRGMMQAKAVLTKEGVNYERQN